jgi:hypothetical protein
MPTIINFGMPRSGTTYIRKMFESVSNIQGLGSRISNSILPNIKKDSINNKLDAAKKFFIMLDKNNYYHFKIGEGSWCHPMHSQVLFEDLCSIVPQPVYLFRTYRHPINIYKSLIYINTKGKINVEPRFRSTDLNSIIGMILSEHGGYVTIRNNYNIKNICFDDKQNILQSFDILDPSISKQCKKFVEDTYNKKPVRRGRLQDKTDINISKNEEYKLNTVALTLMSI